MNALRVSFPILVAAALAAACGSAQASPAPSAAAQSSSMRTADVARGTISQTVRLSGSVRSAAQYRLGFKLPGRLAERAVAPGDRVEAGQLLARLESADLQAAVVAAQARYDQVLAGATPEDVASARLAVDTAQRTMDTTQRTTANDLTAAKDALTQLLAHYSAAKASLQTLASGIETDTAALQNQLADSRTLARRVITDIQSSVNQTGDVLGARNAMVSVDGALGSAQDLLTATRAAYDDYLLQRDNMLAAVALFDRSASATATQNFQVALTSYNAAASRYSASLDAVLGQIIIAATTTSAAQGTLGGTALRIFTDLDAARASLARLTVSLSTTQQSGGSVKGRIAQIAASVPTIASYVSGGFAGAQQAVTNAQQRGDSSLIASQNALEGAHLALQRVSAAPKAYDVAASYAALLLAQSNLDGATLRAPAAGTVLAISAELGENVAAPFLVLNSATLQLHGTVGETDVAKLKAGQQATIRVEAIGNASLSGTITAIDAGAVQAGVPLYGVDVTIGDPLVELRPGMSGAAEVVVASRANVLLVPTATVRIQGTRTFVQVVKDGRMVDREVALGVAGDGMTEITNGLAMGETVAFPRERGR